MVYPQYMNIFFGWSIEYKIFIKIKEDFNYDENFNEYDLETKYGFEGICLTRTGNYDSYNKGENGNGCDDSDDEYYENDEKLNYFLYFYSVRDVEFNYDIDINKLIEYTKNKEVIAKVEKFIEENGQTYNNKLKIHLQMSIDEYHW